MKVKTIHAVKQKTLMQLNNTLHVSVYLTHHRAPLLRKLKNINTFYNMKLFVSKIALNFDYLCVFGLI
jgi:hypothetical protein